MDARDHALLPAAPLPDRPPGQSRPSAGRRGGRLRLPRRQVLGRVDPAGRPLGRHPGARPRPLRRHQDQGSGLTVVGDQVGRRHRKPYALPRYDFEGAATVDAAKDHGRAFAGGMSYQQACQEYVVSRHLWDRGMKVLPRSATGPCAAAVIQAGSASCRLPSGSSPTGGNRRTRGTRSSVSRPHSASRSSSSRSTRRSSLSAG